MNAKTNSQAKRNGRKAKMAFAVRIQARLDFALAHTDIVHYF